MKKHEVFRLIVISGMIVISLFLIIACSDSIAKQLNKSSVRVEYSNCNGCLECTTLFQCKYDAFVWDDRTKTVFIDADKCVGCLDCINDFECKQKAITLKEDKIAPGEISDFEAISDSVGHLEISFIAPGDDGNTGIAHLYEVNFYLISKNQNKGALSIDFTPDYPLSAGELEKWSIEGFPGNQKIKVSIKAYDEVKNSSLIFQSADILILGEEVDNIAPAPINDLASEATENCIKLTWTAPGDDEYEGLALNYEIRYSTSDITEANWIDCMLLDSIPLPSLPHSAEEIIIDDLTPNTNYNFAIKTFDNRNNVSPISNVVSANQTDQIAPAAITDLFVNNISNSAIQLRWTATGDDGNYGSAVNYLVRYSTANITENNWENAQTYAQNISPQNAGLTEYLSISGLPENTKYYFAVKAVDNFSNNSPVSNVVSAIQTDLTAPGTINDLVVNSISINSLQLKWTAVGDDGNIGSASGYIVKYSYFNINESNWATAVTYQQTIIPQNPGTQETLWIDGLTEGTEYYFAVKAVDNVQNISAISNIATESTSDIQDVIAPSVIDDLSASPSETTVILSWTAPGDDQNEGTCSRYFIKYSLSTINSANWNNATDIVDQIPTPMTAGAEQSVVVTGLEYGQIYFFAMKAIDESDNSSDVSVNATSSLLGDTIAPAQIDDLTAAPSENSITLQWTAPGDDGDNGTADHYQIRYSVQNITEANWESATLFSSNLPPASAGTIQNISINSLNYETDYFFAIKAFDDFDNESPLSNIAESSLLTDNIPPATTNNLSVITGLAVNISTIRITWTAPGDDASTGTAHHYEVRYSLSAITDNNWQNASLANNIPAPANPGTTQTMNVTGLDEATIYYFAIKTFDEQGNVSGVSNSPAGKIVYQVDSGPCNGCNICINRCPEDAIVDHGSYVSIDADLCLACGDCLPCPRNAIRLSVVAYNQPARNSYTSPLKRLFK